MGLHEWTGDEHLSEVTSDEHRVRYAASSLHATSHGTEVEVTVQTWMIDDTFVRGSEDEDALPQLSQRWEGR